MAITKIDTPALPAMGAESKGGSNALLWILGLAALGWAGYEFWWKPNQEKEKQAKS